MSLTSLTSLLRYILRGIRARLDDGAVVGQGVVDIAEDGDAEEHEDDVGQPLGGECGGDGDAADAEDDDEVAADADGALEADDHLAVSVGPPAGIDIALRQMLRERAHSHECAVECIGYPQGVGKEN